MISVQQIIDRYGNTEKRKKKYLAFYLVIFQMFYLLKIIQLKQRKCTVFLGLRNKFNFFLKNSLSYTETYYVDLGFTGLL